MQADPLLNSPVPGRTRIVSKHPALLRAHTGRDGLRLMLWRASWQRIRAGWHPAPVREYSARMEPDPGELRAARLCSQGVGRMTGKGGATRRTTRPRFPRGVAEIGRHAGDNLGNFGGSRARYAREASTSKERNTLERARHAA
jgi:hypothetical protein